MEDLSGKTIRGYEIRERIGEGGFGIVYRAYQPAIKRDVVLKAILPIYANNPDFIRSFEAEAQLIARLEHLHIVPLYDYWRGPEGAFLIMRWLRGGSLLESLRTTSWDIHAASRLVDQIAGALAIAHRHNVIHQDLKPANILLDEETNAYLTDFGLARDLDEDIDLSASTLNTTIRGSPAYISPEQIRRSIITPRADIYSLGMVMYEIICGQHPFGTTNIVELLRHQLNTQLPSIHEYRPDLPGSINLVLWRATAKDPELRYATTIELADAFRKSVSEYGVEQSSQEIDSRPSGAASQSDTGIISLASLDALLAEPPNPYKGLRPFKEADADDFFGRSALIESLLNRLRETGDGHRFLAVVGPSGSGKSSVVKAGLIPALRGGRIEHWQKWFIVEMTPGKRPTKELVQALARVATTPLQTIQTLLQHSGGLHHAVREVLPDDHSELILVIDQFEELYTQTAGPDERAHFLGLLHHAVTITGSRLRLIITLRADFYDRPLLHTGLGDLVRMRTEVVLPMTTAELRDAIVGPAERVNLLLEPGLAERLIAAVADQPSALPLLQFTLTELYEQRKREQLTLEAYEAIGGVSGALARRADELYHQMSPAERPVVEQIFLRLVALGEGTEDTRRRALQSELMSLSDEEAARRVVDTFGRYRLLTFDRDPATRAPTVEIAHEALIRGWGRLRDWLSDNRDQLRLHRQMTTSVNEWLASSRDPSFLAAGAKLAQYETLAKSHTLSLTTNEQSFFRASIQRSKRTQRLRRALFLAVSLIAVLFLALTLIAISQRNRADTQAQIAQSRELAASSQVVANQADLSLLLSLEALNVANTFEARSSLLAALQRYPHLTAILNGHTDWIRTVAYSADGTRMLSGGRDGTVRIWDNMAHQTIGVLDTHEGSWVNTVAFSLDSRHVASGADDGSLILWDLESQPPQAHKLIGHTGPVWSVAFSPDGLRLASAGADNMVRLWDTQTGAPIADLSGHQNIIYAVAFSPDGRTLASASADNTIRLWDPQTLAAVRVLDGHSNWVFAVTFSPDGRTLASASADGTIRLWDALNGTSLGSPLRGHSNWVRTLQFTSDGRRIVSGGADGVVLIWDAATGAPLDGFTMPGAAAVWSVALSPDDRTILTGGTDNAAYLWDMLPGAPVAQVIERQSEQILAVATNRENSLAAAAGGLHDDFSVKLWEVPTYSLQKRLTGHSDQVTTLAFSPTAPYLASGSLDHKVIVWDLSTGEPVQTLQAQDSVFSVAFRSDGLQLAIGDNSGIISLWDLHGAPDEWKPLTSPLEGHTDRVLSVAYRPGGSLLASGSRDATIRLWDSTTGQPVGEPLTGHTDGILDLAFSPNGDLLASASRDMTIRLWSAQSGIWQPDGEPITGHTNWVMSVDFSPDGTQLASASGDHSVILWDIETRRMLGEPFQGHTDWVNAVAFSPDSGMLYSAGRDGQFIMWLAGLNRWRDRACQIANRNISSDEQIRYFPDQPTNTIVCPGLAPEVD